MGVEKWYERFGTPEDKTPEIVVSKDKLNRVAAEKKHRSDNRSSIAKQTASVLETGNQTSEQSRDAKTEVIEHEPAPEENIDRRKVTNLEGRLAKTEEERDAAFANIKTVEESHKQEVATAKAQAEELTAQREATEKVAKAAKAELEDIGGQLQESQRTVSSLHFKLGTLEAEIGAMKCPDCGAIVDWDIMPIRECPLESYKRGNPEEWCLVLGKVEMVKYRRCPHCKHVEWYPDKVEVKT